jgi:hypothetical protein
VSEVKTQPRRLVELNPRWVENTTGEVYGLAYDCPCGLPTFTPVYDQSDKVSIGPDGKVVGEVPYAQCCPRSGREVVPTKGNFTGKPTCADSLVHGWGIAGTSFDDVTLHPSIHAVGHWHGFLRNGTLESC